jgi:hypothetical protein
MKKKFETNNGFWHLETNKTCLIHTLNPNNKILNTFLVYTSTHVGYHHKKPKIHLNNF